ncbi:DUF5610 domain-containing protein [Alteromonas sp. C1M14]|uniref:DUF5610 domain-containing protein n=1 Tax=Alteromonas sp. C1M14 TaxID=2841567 RepID=UPI001C08B14B|nr:DUF5610 domain-containing protein [Alteromonas sp. C1M14]MBU2976597.1 DUF5610 domain-containing protein [Alteromonas sp. C1M14]
MNVSDIKAFVSEQKPVVSDKQVSEDPNSALKKQLQQDGLRQAAEFQQQVATVNVKSSQTTIGLKVYSSSMEQQVTVAGQKGKFDKTDDTGKDNPASLFDFEEVARNVMRFVGGVIQGAADSGADTDTLSSLFSQARDGVAKGIAMAERDLGNMINDEITTGISSSRDLIEERLGQLESNLLGNTPATEVLQQVVGSPVASGSESSSAGLLIRTKDGDELQLRFESVNAFQTSQQQMQRQSAGQDGITSDNANDSSTISQQYAHFERQGIHFSLQGELDEDELTAIAGLVGSVSDLADTFFAGDIDQAFNDALALGYDDQELAGYALQLNRVQQSEVVKTYGEIQHFKEGSESANHGDEARPIAQYLDKMLNVFDNARQQLGSGEDFNTLINGIINEMEEVQVPDLISAINRFHGFNQTLLSAIPGEQQRTQPIEPGSSTQSNEPTVDDA